MKNILGNSKAQYLCKKMNIFINVQKKWNGYGFDIYGRFISELDWEKISKIIIEENEKEKEKIILLLKNPDKIAESIYSINKEAKRQRDIKDSKVSCLYGDNYGDNISLTGKYLAHHQLHKAKYKQSALYELKNSALSKFIKENKLIPLGFHSIKFQNRNVYGILYNYKSFSFHYLSEDKPEEIPEFGGLKKIISSERQKSIPPKKAKILLELYLET